MKKKIKFLSFLATIITTSTILSLSVVNNNTSSLCVSKQEELKNKTNLISSNKDVTTKTFSASLIGALDGTFTVEFTDYDHCKITKVSKDFFVAFDYNFNNGRFSDNNINYTITEIGESVFKCGQYDWTCFKKCVLTIPSTIKKIGNYAFYGNSSTSITWDGIICVKFEDNGIEYIGKEAFAYLSDVIDYSNMLILPNSLKYVAYDAFSYSYPIWDLTKLDHVIESNGDMSINFILHYTCTDEIQLILKDEKIKNEYCNNINYHWLAREGAIIVDGEKKLNVNFSIFSLLNTKTYYPDGRFVYEYRFCVEYRNKNDCKLTQVGRAVEIENINFTFGDHGHFTISNLGFTITKIGEEIFDCNKYGNGSWFFIESNLTIPSTIKVIEKYAFNNNSRNTILSSKEIRAINFEEGVEEIQSYAFRKCKDIKDKTIKLPNSLKNLSVSAFEGAKVEVFDLSGLDHVINITCDENKESYSKNKVDKIYVKDEIMKAKYLADKSWSKIAKKIYVK